MFLYVKNNNKKEASVMIESLIATTLIVIGLLGIFNLFSSSIKKSITAVHKLQAVYLAAEGIEVVKNILDTNYSNGYFLITNAESINKVSYNTTDQRRLNQNVDIYTIFFDGLKFYQSDTENPNEKTIFERNISITNNSQNLIVSSTVSWAESDGKEFSVTLNDIFYNWRPRRVK